MAPAFDAQRLQMEKIYFQLCHDFARLISLQCRLGAMDRCSGHYHWVILFEGVRPPQKGRHGVLETVPESSQYITSITNRGNH